MTETLIIIGQLGAPYGVRGWQHIQSHSHPAENILGYQDWFIAQKEMWVPFKLEAGRRHGQGIVAKLATIEDREAAAVWSNAKIAVKRDHLAPLAQNEFYWADLEGLNVYSPSGEAIGQLEYLYENAGSPIMVVQDAVKERHIPFLMHDTVMNVDLASRKIVIDWDLTL